VFYYDGWSWYLRRTAALPSIQPVAWGLCIILNIFARSVLFFFMFWKHLKKIMFSIFAVQRRWLQPSPWPGATTGGNNDGLRPRKDYGKLFHSLPFGYAIIIRIINKRWCGASTPQRLWRKAPQRLRRITTLTTFWVRARTHIHARVCTHTYMYVCVHTHTRQHNIMRHMQTQRLTILSSA